MKYIIDCPSCGRKIRFPLDKGRIKIFCSCGYNTVIDPDDTALYKSGKFDLKPGEEHSEKADGFFHSLSSLLDSFKWNSFVNSLLEVKYKLQNFRYLPDMERNIILTVIVISVLGIAAAVYYF